MWVAVFQFSQAGLTLSTREGYLQDADKLKEAFLSFAVRVGKLLGGDNSTQQKMEAVYNFEKSLAEVGGVLFCAKTAIFFAREQLAAPSLCQRWSEWCRVLVAVDACVCMRAYMCMCVYACVHTCVCVRVCVCAF